MGYQNNIYLAGRRRIEWIELPTYHDFIVHLCYAFCKSLYTRHTLDRSFNV